MTHARHYVQVLDDADANQTADDDIRIAAPQEVLTGRFTIYAMQTPGWPAGNGYPCYLLSVATAADEAAFRIVGGGEGGQDPVVQVRIDGVNYVSGYVCAEGSLWTEGEARFTFDAVAGTIVVEGHVNGVHVVTTHTGTPWALVGGEMRLGGSVLGGGEFQGWVSLPYAVSGVAVAEPVSLDFTDENNSQWLPMVM